MKLLQAFVSRGARQSVGCRYEGGGSVFPRDSLFTRMSLPNVSVAGRELMRISILAALLLTWAALLPANATAAEARLTAAR